MRLPIPPAAVPPSVRSTCARLMRGCATLTSRLVNAAGRRLNPVDPDLAAVLDLFVEHAYVGEITADGRYIDHTSGPAFPSYVGGDVSADTERGPLWESLIAAADRPAYESFNRQLLTGRAAEVTYRLVGLDGVTRTIWDRARAVRHPDGSATVRGIISDVSERVAANARAAEAAERFERLLDVVGEHVYLAAVLDDGTMREIFQGPGADRLLGGAEPDPEMVNWEAAIHPDDRAAYDAFNAALAAGRPGDVEYRLIGADGVTRWLHDRAATKPGIDGTIEISGIVSDVTSRRLLEDELRRSMSEMQQAHRELDEARRAAQHLARTDELTGAYNRRHFAERVSAVAAGRPRGYGLLLLDADHFKQVNDRHGHAVGDAVLVELARRLRSALGAGDVLARWGGEEFAVLLSAVGSDARLRERCEALRQAVAATPIFVGGVHVRLTISIGATGGVESGAPLDRMIDAADRALYAAKEAGRDRVCLAAEALRDAA